MIVNPRWALPSALVLLAASVQAGGPPPPARGEALAQAYALADARRFDAAAFATLVRHPDPAVRVAALRALGHLANPDALRLVGAAADDPVPDVRAAAAEAGGRLAADLTVVPGARGPAVTLLGTLLGDRDAVVRRAAAWAIGMAGEPFAALLAHLRNETDASARAAMLAELWRSQGDWIPVAAASLADPDRDVRLAAAWSLARSGAAAATEALRRATRDPDPAVRAVAFDGARRGQASAFREELLRGIEDPDVAVRIAALGALVPYLEARKGETVSAEIVRRLQAALDDRRPGDVHERVMAIRAAAVAGCCAEALRSLAADLGTWTGGEALEALARQGSPDAGTLCAAWLASDKAAVRAAAVAAAALLPDGSARLAALLGDASPAVRLAALERSGGAKSSVDPAEATKLLGDADPAVRAAAVEALAKRDALPASDVLLGMLAKENGSAMPDAAVAIVEALARGKVLAPAVEKALDGLAAGRDPVVARAAWAALRGHGVAKPLPVVATADDIAFYRRVEEWAVAPRWLQIVTVRGTMQVELDTAAAPLSSFRIAELAGKGFFDGLTFHRVVPDFVAQGGDPRGDGWGGPGFVMRDEDSLTPFAPGSVGLALSGPDTGGSQLFVTLTRQPHLDGRYPNLGRVVAGLDVAWRLRRGDRILRVAAGEGPLPTFFPVWYGRLDPGRIDAAIDGWKRERQAYRPQEKWLALLRTAKLRYELTAAMGTWCSDSREQIPRLQAVLSALGDRSPFAPPELVGIDRSKEVDAALYRFGPVEKVPTIVVTTGGSEVGRIVETPSSGSVEEDLVRILAPVEGWDVPPPEPKAAH